MRRQLLGSEAKRERSSLYLAILRQDQLRNRYRFCSCFETSLHASANRVEVSLLTDKYDPGFQRNAAVQVLDVVVHKPNASGSNEMPNRLRRICSVDNQPGLVQQ
jgi:hypothetical protein